MGTGETLILTAPGKLFLFGEYAVLSGLPALLMAVPLYGSYRGPLAPESFVYLYPGGQQKKEILLEKIGYIDTTTFYQGTKKRGFGSSAVACVLKAGVLLWGSWSLEALFSLALKIHQEEVGATSGADLLAVLHGGVGLAYPAIPRFSPVTVPPGLSFVVVDAATPSNSRYWIERYREQEERAGVRQWLGKVESWFQGLKGDPVLTLEQLHSACTLYRELTEFLGEELYPPRFRHCEEMARKLSIPFKPSGAGGGDLGIFFVREKKQELLQELERAGIPYQEWIPAGTGLSGALERGFPHGS